MNTNILWSLRLGFSNKQSKMIEKMGLKPFLNQSFDVNFDATVPDFLIDSPKTIEEFKEIRKARKQASPEEKKLFLRKNTKYI
jgi:hypothetical protein